jgi:hypothetical protein
MATITLTNGTLTNGRIEAFSPLTYNPGMWLDAKDHSTFTLAPSNKISVLRDKSSNGYDLSQGVELDQPVYSATAFNGKPGIQFVEANTTYLNRNMVGTFISDPGISGAMTSFAVFNNSANPGTRIMMDSGYGVNRRGFCIGNFSLQERSQIQTASSSWVSPGAQWTQNTDTILTSVWDGSTLDIWNNGVFKQSTNSAANAGVDNRTNFNIGTGSIPGLYMEFVFAELIIYPVALTNVQRKNVEFYLKNKWGI